MKNYREILEAKKSEMTITIINPKDFRKALDVLIARKIKFRDESSDFFVFANQNQWEKAMDILDEKNIEFNIY